MAKAPKVKPLAGLADDDDPYAWDAGHVIRIFHAARGALSRTVALAEGRS